MAVMSGRRPGVMVVLAVAAALVYAGFLGWDRDEDVDPVTGGSTGPYDTWQIACDALALGLLAYCGGRAQHAWAAAAAVSLGFTAAWSVGAATAETEDANLWPVGAAFLLVGILVSTAALALLTRRFSRPRTPPARAGVPGGGARRR
jgi:peptidoglycan/LPS O-acetylase OafA/YrhL